MSAERILLVIWLAFTGISLLLVTAVLIWAVRTRQFSRQNRARYLALRAGIPPPAAPRKPPCST